MKSAKEKPNIDVLLTTRNPYKNTYTKEIKYLDIREWMLAESKSKQVLLAEFTEEAVKNAIKMTAEEFKDILNAYHTHLNKIVIWEIIEDKPSVRILYGKKDV